MDNVNLEEIEFYLNEKNYLTSSKENHVYRFDDEVVKIFNDNSDYTFDRLSDCQLKLLASFPLKSFNNIIGFIEKGEEGNKTIVGYKEKYLEHEEFDSEHLYSNEKLYNLAVSLDDIKDDIKILSENGLEIKDIEYNYFYKDGRITFNNIINYIKHDISVKEYKELLKCNYKTVSLFLIGLIIYNGYKNKNVTDHKIKGSINKYYEKHCKDKFFGDLFKEMYSIDKDYKTTKKV